MSPLKSLFINTLENGNATIIEAQFLEILNLAVWKQSPFI